MRYEFINPEDMTELDPTKEYTTRIVNISYEKKSPTVLLEFMGDLYDPKNPTCVFPVKDNPEYHVHPFID